MYTAVIKRRRDAVGTLISRLRTKLEELKGKTDPRSLGVAQSMAHKLESLDSEFHTHHYSTLLVTQIRTRLQGSSQYWISTTMK